MTRVQTSHGWRSPSVRTMLRCAVSVIAFILLSSQNTDDDGPGSMRCSCRLQLVSLFCEQLDVALWTEVVLAFDVAMLRADRKGRGDRDIGQAEPLECPPHQLLAGVGTGDSLVHVKVQYGSAGVLFLQGLLPLQRLERIVGETDRQLRRVGVVRHRLGPGLQDGR